MRSFFLVFRMTDKWKAKKEALRFEDDSIGALTQFRTSFYVWNDHRQVFIIKKVYFNSV